MTIFDIYEIIYYNTTMDKKIFIPILKSKTRSEPVVLEKCHDLFSNEVIPYIEFIARKPKDNNKKTKNRKNVNNKIKFFTRDILHFEEICRLKNKDNIDTIIVKTKDIKDDNAIPSIHIINENELNENIENVIDFIQFEHNNKKNCSIRITGDIKFGENIKKVIDLLTKDDFLIIDIGENSYISSEIALKYYFDYQNRKSKIIIFSEERPSKLTNKDLEADDYNKNIHSFNVSVIDSIKNDQFVYDGFGSYCSARNDINNGGSGKNVFAIFMLFNYLINDFFSYKSDTANNIHISYAQLKNKLQTKRKIAEDILKDTPLSDDMFKKLIDTSEKPVAYKFITISIIHHIETIYNNLIS